MTTSRLPIDARSAAEIRSSKRSLLTRLRGISMRPRHKHWDRDNIEVLPVNMSSYSSTSARSTVGLVIPTFYCSIIDLLS